MFLSQKFNYVIENLSQFETLIEAEKPEYVVFDTETTGLNFMEDKPFLFTIGFNKHLFHFEPTKKNVLYIYSNLKHCSILFAHNTKYDWHMMVNNETPLPEDVLLGDGMTVARLTSFADDISGIGLDDLGTKYVDESAKFASKVIRKKLNEINKRRLVELKDKLKTQKLPCKVQELVEAYRNKVQFVVSDLDEWIRFIDNNFTEANYYDIYVEDPNLMIMYALDDVVILLEYLNKALPALKKHYGELPKIFYQECSLIPVVGKMERNGIRADIDYLLSSRNKVKDYIDITYIKLKEISGMSFSSGQHKVIKQLFSDKFDIFLQNCDVQSLQEIVNKKVKRLVPTVVEYDYIKENEFGSLNYYKSVYDDNGELLDEKVVGVVEFIEIEAPQQAKEIANLIIELRTLDKWLSTYIEGMLNRVYNERIYTSINNSGAVTGRVSSDMQQQPSEPLLTRTGEELFHPRRVFINDEEATTYYFDFSQMELRLQAEYTLRVSDGDTNLCRAFIPFKCKSMFTDEEYKIGVDDWKSEEWINENNEIWTKLDLHAETALRAFPNVKRTDPDFAHYRKLGKVANFLKNYAGGANAIKEQLGVSDEIARALDRAYYEAFPKIKDYQNWIEQTLTKQGYVENLFGRRYYISSPKYYYKSYNYVIQGGCADILKEKEIKVYELLKGKESKMLLPVHDELQISIHKSEKDLIPLIKAIMDESSTQIPMLCDVEYTESSWADKKDWE